MKKLFALLLTLCLLGSVAFANELTWASVEETASQIDGEFKDIAEVNAKIWIPAILQSVELNSEDEEEGIVAYYMTEDQEAAVSINYVNFDGTTLEEYAELLKEDEDVSEIEMGTVNGIPALSYEVKERDTGVVAFTTEQGYILEVACAPMSDEGFVAVAGIILSSIQSK